MNRVYRHERAGGSSTWTCASTPG